MPQNGAESSPFTASKMVSRLSFLKDMVDLLLPKLYLLGKIILK